MPGNLTSSLEDRVKGALKVAFIYGNIKGEKYNQWVIDQMVRALAGGEYEEWVDRFNSGGDGPNTYSWEVGYAP